MEKVIANERPCVIKIKLQLYPSSRCLGTVSRKDIDAVKVPKICKHAIIVSTLKSCLNIFDIFIL